MDKAEKDKIERIEKLRKNRARPKTVAPIGDLTNVEKLQTGSSKSGGTKSREQIERDYHVERERRRVEAEQNAREHEKRKRQALFAQSSVPKRHRDWQRPESIDPDWEAAYQKAQQIVDDGGLVAIIGERWRGKTQLAVECIRASCEKNVKCLYIRALDLFNNIRESMSVGRGEETKMLNRLRAVGVLAIDEGQERADTQFEDRTLVNLIDHRYGDGRATILLSNQNERAFTDSMGESIMRRLVETGDCINCDWGKV